MKKIQLFSIFCGAAFLLACDSLTNTGNSSNAAVDPMDAFAPIMTNYDGFLFATKTFIEQETPSIPGFPSQTFEVEVGTAVAGFGNLSTMTLNDVGEVSLNLGTTPKKYTLSKQANNSYVFIPSETEATGLPLSNATGGIPFWQVPSLSISSSSPINGFPSQGTIVSSKTISKNQGYTFQVSGIQAADSVIFIIASEGKHVSKTLPLGSNMSVSFTAAELSALPNSTKAILQVSPYYLAQKTFSGKNYIFLHQTVVTAIAEIKN